MNLSTKLFLHIQALLICNVPELILMRREENEILLLQIFTQK